MKTVLFLILLSLSGLSFGVTQDQIIGQYSIHEKHETVTGVGFGYSYKINFYKESDKVLARYQADGRGVAIDYICNVKFTPNNVVLTFSELGADAKKYGYRTRMHPGDNVLTLIPGNKNESIILKVDGFLGEMENPILYKQ